MWLVQNLKSNKPQHQVIVHLKFTVILYFNITEEILQYSNMDLESIKTPVNVTMLKQLLQESKYDKKESEFLIDGFTNGFSIGYTGPEDVKLHLQTSSSGKLEIKPFYGTK